MRPARPPDLLAVLEGTVPARVAKRVRENPALAEAWTWSADGTEVRTEDVTVRVTVPVGPASFACTCLMGPKCVHVFAVASALPEAEAVVEASKVVEEAPPVDVSATAAALGRLLVQGGAAADAVVRAELTRLAFDARGAGLHRLGRALTRLVRSLRLLAAGHPTFTLDGLVEELTEALTVTRGLGRSATADLVGEARRTYESVGTLRLWGVWSEPVLSGTGAAGVVTWLADNRGRLWSVPDIRPRPAGQVLGLYDVAPPISTLSHRKLSRDGLFVQNATAAQGRLGAGEAVAAVRAVGVPWSGEPLAALWGSPAGANLPEEERPRFLDGVVRGLWRDALVVEADGPHFVLPGSEHASLPWRDNLRLLGRLPGTAVRLVVRPVPGRRRAVIGLAVSVGDLPADWGGRVNLGLDRLTTAHLPGISAQPTRLEGELADTPDPFAALRRRVGRVALGGAATLPGEALGEVSREVARLRLGAATGAADLLAWLATRGGSPEFPEAWLAASRYLAAADRTRG